MKRQALKKTITKKLKSRSVIFYTILALLFLLFIALGNNLKVNIQRVSDAHINYSIRKDAIKIYETCKNQSKTKQCIADYFYILTKKYNSTYATNSLMQLQKLDSENTSGCHVIAHKISQAQTEKDPAKWESILKKVPSTMCTGGFIHGVLETHIATDPEFKIDEKSITKICSGILQDVAGNQFAERSCAHNLGHLMLIQEENKILNAVDKCNKIVNPQFNYECLSGVFMERLTTENLIAHDLVKIQPTWDENLARETEKNCENYTEAAERACWNELSYVYISISNYAPNQLYKECQRAPSQELRDGCYIYGAGNLVNSAHLKPENLMSLCHQFEIDDPIFRSCMNQTLGSLLTSTTNNINKTLKICEQTYTPYRDTCYKQIVRTLTENNASPLLIQEACSKIEIHSRTQVCTS